MSIRSLVRLVLAGILGLALLVPMAGAASAGSKGLRDRIELPDGFQPEGITIGPGPIGFFGSRVDGDIYAANLRSGQGRVISQGPGTPAVGLKSDGRRLLYVSGGTSGTARVVDIRSGRTLRTYQLGTGNTFINDVVLGRHVAWFTDSRNATLYAVPLARRGQPAPARAVRAVPLSGAWRQSEAVDDVDANGIAFTPDRRALLVVQSSTGFLYRVDPWSGRAARVDLGDTLLTNGDGLLVEGRTLYAVQNRLNKVAVVKLNSAGTRGRLIKELTSPDFDVPTTVASYKGSLFLPNARFTTPPTPTTDYWVTRIDK